MSVRTELGDSPEHRRVYRCIPCNLVQFETRNSKCRRCSSEVLKRMQEKNQPVFLPHQNSLKAVSLIGKQVRVLRELRGLTRRAFSVLLLPYVSRSYVYRIESGCIKPSLETLERIAVALDLPLGAFFLDPESLETQVYSRYVQQITPFLKLVPDRSFETILSFVREMRGPALVKRRAQRAPATQPIGVLVIQPSPALVTPF